MRIRYSVSLHRRRLLRETVRHKAWMASRTSRLKDRMIARMGRLTCTCQLCGPLADSRAVGLDVVCEVGGAVGHQRLLAVVAGDLAHGLRVASRLASAAGPADTMGKGSVGQCRATDRIPRDIVSNPADGGQCIVQLTDPRGVGDRGPGTRENGLRYCFVHSRPNSLVSAIAKNEAVDAGI